LDIDEEGFMPTTIEGPSIEGPSVVDETGHGVPFEPSHLTGSLVKANVPPSTAIHAADVVHGVLQSAFHATGSATVSPNQLRAVAGEVATNPKFDPAVIARILTKPEVFAINRPAAMSARLQTPIPQLFASIVAGAGSDIPSEQLGITGIGYLEATLNDSTRVEQYLAFGRNASGAAMEFADGAVKGVKPLDTVGPWAALPGGGRELQPLSVVFNKLDGLHPAWSGALTGPHLRSISLINVGSDIGIYPPLYVATAIIPSASMVAVFNAMTGALIVQTPIVLTGMFAQQAIFASAWKTAWDVLCKALSIVAMGATIAGLAGGGAISAPSGVGPVAAALGITALVVAIGVKLTEIMLELFGPDKAKNVKDKMDKFREKFDKLNKGVQDGSISNDSAKQQLQGLNGDLKDLQGSVNEFINENGDPLGALGEGMQTFGDGMEKLAEAVK
jgi:hypothetical protein